jgi:predicted nucleic acid-binding Zn ribbon protein
MVRKTVGYVNLVWYCPSCGVKNLGTQRTCQGCGKPQPDDVTFQKPEQDHEITDDKVIEAAKKGADIHCAYCGARNPADAKICVQCGADLSSSKKRQAGAVLGAVQTAEVPQRLCPSCKTPNPETNQTCSKCGAPLEKPIQAAPALPTKKINPLWIIIGIIAGIVICILLSIALFSGSGGNNEIITGTVDAVHWERSIAILGMVQTEKSDWLENIQQSATIGTCTKEYHHTEDSPVEGSVEVCGTPYVVDTGSGVGEEVVDCVYEVYLDYCTYTDYEWSVIDTAAVNGNDLDPYWPDLSLDSQQQEGDRTESYICSFQTSQGEIDYQTSSYNEFTQCQMGSEWDLEVNSRGQIVGLTEK